MKQKYIKIIITIISLVIFDQLIKNMVVNLIGSNSIVIFKNFLEFIYIQNKGAAFGILNNNVTLLILITLIFLIYLIIEMNKNINKKLTVFSIILIISGSIGNLIDRIMNGYVIDFIYFRLFNIDMPVFNIADIFITFGILLYIYKLVKDDKSERSNSK